MDGNTLSASDETEFLGRGSLDIHLRNIGFEIAGDQFYHGTDMGRHLRYLGQDSDIRISELV